MKIGSDVLSSQLEALRQSRVDLYDDAQGDHPLETLAESGIKEAEATSAVSDARDPATDLLMTDVWAADSPRLLSASVEPLPAANSLDPADWVDRLVAYVLA